MRFRPSASFAPPTPPAIVEFWIVVELDEPVTALEFVTRADVDADNCVHIEFRLPTYWCAANFSFLMADDMRLAIGVLPWVGEVGIDPLLSLRK